MLEIFEPSLCCDSGVCGPEPDKDLIELQNTIQLLKKAGIETKRYAINHAPLMFVQNAVVRDFIKANGSGQLPLTLLDNKIIKSGAYPTIAELREVVPELRDIKPDTRILGVFG